MDNSWTNARRARQAKLIQRWRPWERSTGPRTNRGKARAARNALKHGERSAAAIAFTRQLRRYLRAVAEATVSVGGSE